MVSLGWPEVIGLHRRYITREDQKPGVRMLLEEKSGAKKFDFYKQTDVKDWIVKKN
jgi:hypothetical protein